MFIQIDCYVVLSFSQYGCLMFVEWSLKSVSSLGVIGRVVGVVMVGWWMLRMGRKCGGGVMELWVEGLGSLLLFL